MWALGCPTTEGNETSRSSMSCSVMVASCRLSQNTLRLPQMPPKTSSLQWKLLKYLAIQEKYLLEIA
jgi:hypothetical protein